MADRLLTISLRNVKKSTRNYQATRAVHYIKEHVRRHTKNSVRISPLVNEQLWKQSRQRPPSSIKIKIDDQEEYSMVRLPEEHVPLTKKPEKGRLDALKKKARSIQQKG